MKTLFAALVAAALLWAAGGRAQDPTPATPPEWDSTIEEALALVESGGAATDELEALRDRLLRMRSAAIELEAGSAAQLADVNARLEALGPAPAEGATEPPEIAQRRSQITQEQNAAQVPVLEAQDFQRRAEQLIREIDQVVRTRFADELRSRGPTPLVPGYWFQTAAAVRDNLGDVREDMAATLRNPIHRHRLSERLPLDLTLAVGGMAIAFGLRRRLAAWADGGLARATNPRTIALLFNLRNFSRLIVPAVGGGMLFAALDPANLTDPAPEKPLFVLPSFVLAPIAATWLGASLFAPRLPAFRLAPLDTNAATRGARLTIALGLLLGASFFLRRYSAGWTLSPAEAATLVFPLFLIGGFLLWRVSRLLRSIRRRILERDAGLQSGERAGAITLSVLRVAERAAWAVGLAAPILAAIGYLAAASFLQYSLILTLGLLGAWVVLYDLATRTLGAIGRAETGAATAGDASGDSLVPVLVAAVLTVLALPALALVWGARPSDLAGVWFMLRDGVTFGGMRISLGMVATFAVVFGVLYGMSRLLQSVLRNSVLPRTRLDAGGKNAILAGVGYAGFFIAAVAAVSSTGINLTSLAVVAGALSVGIGFGLQNIVSNFVSGIILLVERPIKEGDWIEVGGFAGYVRGISVRSTEIETFDRASVILPNSDLVAGSVLNRTHSGMSGRLQVPVQVTLDSDPRLVERILLEIAEKYPLVLTDPSPRVLLLEVGPDALLFEIRCWLRDVNFSLSAKSDMNFEIMERFNAAGIELQPAGRAPRLPPPEPEPAAAQAPPPPAARSA